MKFFIINWFNDFFNHFFINRCLLRFSWRYVLLNLMPFIRFVFFMNDLRSFYFRISFDILNFMLNHLMCKSNFFKTLNNCLV